MTYKLELSQQDVAVIIQGLGELPLKLSLNVFAKLQKQQSEQDAANSVPLDSVGVVDE